MLEHTLSPDQGYILIVKQYIITYECVAREIYLLLYLKSISLHFVSFKFYD